jgi:hypothetical protein
MSTDDAMRKEAEQEYANTAFDYVQNPIGSKDWCLFWKGWQAASAVKPLQTWYEFHHEVCPENDGHGHACPREPKCCYCGKPSPKRAAPVIPQADPVGIGKHCNVGGSGHFASLETPEGFNVLMGLEHGTKLYAEPPTPQADEISQAEHERYAALEKEHLGDPDKQTGIYAPKECDIEPVAVIGPVYELLWCRKEWSDGLKVGDKLYAEPKKIAASLSRNMDGDDLLLLSNGQSFLLKDLSGWNAAREAERKDAAGYRYLREGSHTIGDNR